MTAQGINRTLGGQPAIQHDGCVRDTSHRRSGVPGWLFCGLQRCYPDAFIGVSVPGVAALACPASQFGSVSYQVPAPGTENDDHNPPRIAPRSLFDIALGDDNLFKGERYKWSLTLTAINVTNKYALYNFLSTFSGTHYVTPRALTAQLGFHF